jgi:hypothetical protein
VTTDSIDSVESAGSADPAEAVVEPWHALGSELIVDEPTVKCWLESVPPGESRPAHTHRHPWLTVVLSGAKGESRRPDGELIAAGEAHAGEVRYNGPDRLPFSHYLTNTSDETLVMLAVELRIPGQQ